MSAPKKAAKKPKRVRSFKLTCAAPACEDAALILARAHESSEALLKAFSLARTVQGKSRGMSTDEEQDLLRAMLVMAAAGLDGMTKQIVRDALPTLIECDEKALASFEKFLARQIRPDRQESDQAGGAKFLAKVLSRPAPHTAAIAEYVRDLTRGSLQSADSLFEVVGALGLWPNEVGIDPKSLGPIFEARNKIIHELDVNLGAERRTRNLRTRPVMIGYTNKLLDVAEQVLAAVDAKLATLP